MDLEVVENGDGGELVKTVKDLSVIYGWENNPYLAMFGGNPGFVSPSTIPAGQQNFDWWGNNQLMPNDPNSQFNSLTEYTLNTVALNSGGIQQIQDAVTQDLNFMLDFASIAVNVSLTGPDRVQIMIAIQQPDNLQTQLYVFLWDATKKELTAKEFATIAKKVIPPGGQIFEKPYFDDFFE